MTGKVWLVGAGPGDPSLITVKGLRCIQQADVLVYDRLVCHELLKEASAKCELINVGKSPSHHPIPQEAINEILIEHASAGKCVVRLKGGDPYVFGRGGEEAESLAKQHLAFEVVPGITSAIGGLAYAGIPVTHRNHASSFHVVTGHMKNGNEPQNWQALAQLDGTLVILMGMSHLASICAQLIEHGKPLSTPAAVVQYASRAEQRRVIGTLANLPVLVEQQKLTAPALIVVGDVIKMHKFLEFHQEIGDLDEIHQMTELS